MEEHTRQWESFVNAFNALGDETRGMTPTAASLLLAAAIDYVNNASGYRPIPAGRPLLTRYSRDGDIIDIRRDYSRCAEFWDIEMNLTRARITQAGVDYVSQHMDVFGILLEGQLRLQVVDSRSAVAVSKEEGER